MSLGRPGVSAMLSLDVGELHWKMPSEKALREASGNVAVSAVRGYGQVLYAKQEIY
jgi:hypothetical protein